MDPTGTAAEQPGSQRAPSAPTGAQVRNLGALTGAGRRSAACVVVDEGLPSSENQRRHVLIQWIPRRRSREGLRHALRNELQRRQRRCCARPRRKTSLAVRYSDGRTPVNTAAPSATSVTARWSPVQGGRISKLDVGGSPASSSHLSAFHVISAPVADGVRDDDVGQRGCTHQRGSDASFPLVPGASTRRQDGARADDRDGTGPLEVETAKGRDDEGPRRRSRRRSLRPRSRARAGEEGEGGEGGQFGILARLARPQSFVPRCCLSFTAFAGLDIWPLRLRLALDCRSLAHPRRRSAPR